MRFRLATDIPALTVYLPNFLALAGGEAWKKRARQLATQRLDSPCQAKIINDYHWPELALSDQMVINEMFGRLDPRTFTLQSLASMYFAGMVMEVYVRLGAKGRTNLEGRLRDGLKAETGFASLYLEMDIALRLLGEGFNVEFPDLEGHDRFDLHFKNDRCEGEVECKSLSADSGRKIHRKDFYRFMDTIGPEMASHAKRGKKEVFLVFLNDRLPSDERHQAPLRTAILQILATPDLPEVDSQEFRIVRESFEPSFESMNSMEERELYRACTDRYGENCHIVCVANDKGLCLVVMRSKAIDDTSKPLLESMKKAASQFSGKLPGFIAVQFNDIEAKDLLLKHVRRLAGIISFGAFLSDNNSHVAATYFCPYGGLTATSEGIGAPAFAVPSPKCRFHLDPQNYPVFLGSMPDAEYARYMGMPPPEEDISYFEFEHD